MTTEPLTVQSGVRRLKRWFYATFAVLVILVALLISVFRMVVPQVPQYRGEIVSWASGVLGAPVSIASLDLQWRGLRPELVLTRVVFVSADAMSAVAAGEVRVGISLRTLLQHGRFAPATITLVDPDVTLVFEAQQATTPGEDWQRAFSTGEHRGELIITRGRVTVLADAGRRRVELRALDLRVSSDGLNHRVRGTARLHEDMGGLLRLSGEARGWPGDPSFSADVRAEARRLDIIGLQQLSRLGRLDAGQLDAVVVLEVDEGEAQRLAIDLGMSGLSWPGTDERDVQRVDRAAGEFLWRRRDDGWDASLQRLDVVRDTGVRTSGPMTVAFTAPSLEDAVAHWDIRAGRMELADLSLLAEVLPWDPSGALQPLLVRTPRGVVEHGSLVIRRPAGEARSFELQLVASGLALDAASTGPIPGFSAAALNVHATEAGGELALSVIDGTFEMPWMFRDQFEVDAAQAEVRWRPSAEGWQVSVPSLTARNADLHAQASMQVDTADASTNTMNARFGNVRLQDKSRYLPVSVMPVNVVSWLDRAIIDGQVPSGTLVYANGELDIEFSIEGLVLDYADGWPRLEDSAVTARVTQEGFAATVHSGRYAGVPVLGGEASISQFRAPELVIDARAGDDMAAMFRGLRETPIGRADWLADARAGGRGQLQLGLNLNLAGGVPIEVDGRVSLQNALFAVGGFDHPVSELRGVVAISGDGFSAEGVTGDLLGAPVVLSARTLRDADGDARAIEVGLAGVLDLPVLERLVDKTGLPVSGSTPWQARVLAPYEDIQAPILQVESTLAGLAIDLPQPLGKPANTEAPLSLQLELGGTQRRLVVESHGRVRADATMRQASGGWRISRGRVHLGPGMASTIPESDVAVSGRLESWNLAVGGLVPRVADTAIPLSHVDLVIGSFTAWGHDLGELSLQGRRSDLGWYWMLDGNRLSGSIDLPDMPTDERPVRVDFARLDMPVAERQRPDLPTHADPSTLPPIAFHTGNFRLGTMHLGEVNGFVRPVENGVMLDGFTATRQEMRMSVDASWHMVDGHHRTVVRGALDSTDVHPTLAALGYIASIDAAAGHLQVDVSWMDSPLANPLHTLDGTLSVRVERGTLHDLQPGAGRIFGLLSLYALPRRLALDFSDVFRRGLAFDSIRGNFRIEQGNAYTDDLILQGPAARVEVSGRTGLSSRDYDQEAVVVGSLASSLTLAGTLMGGPAVGAALLFMSEMLKGPLEDMARARYRLHGPWEDPVVERIPEPARESR